ncbi:MAG: hypothetical protein KJO29_02525 [Bacteroidia bacterium]|nr:hypothetical protein [Bacteroidia bacterium]
MSKINVFLYFILVLSMTSCYDEYDNTETQVIEDEPEVFIDAHLVGELKNLDDERVNNFNLVINGNSYDVDDGIINVDLDYVQEIGQNIIFNTTDGKDAFMSKTMVKNDVNYASVYLFPEHQIMELDTEGHNEIEINDRSGFTINKDQFNLDPSSILSIKFRDLSLNLLANQLGQRGQNQAGELLVVDIQNAFEIHFHRTDGSDAALKDGEMVTVNYNSLSIREKSGLFRYNDENGTWQLISQIDNSEGNTGILESGYYAFANYLPAVIVKSQLELDQKPVAFQLFTIESPGLEIQTRTTISGQWIALLPAEEELELQFTNACGENQQTLSIMSGTGHETIGTISLEGQPGNYLLLNTQILDCNGEASSSSVAIVSNNENNSQLIFPQQMINTYIPVCDNDVSISASDQQSGDVGPVINWNSMMNDELAILSSCEEFEEGFSFIKIDGTEKTFNAFIINFDGERTVLESLDEEFKFTFKGNATGSYPEADVNIRIDDKDFGDKGYYMSCLNSDLGCGINHCEVTHYAQENGQWTRVSFSGRSWMQTIDPAVAGYYDIEGVIMAKK